MSRRERGDTLVEVLIAIAILSAAIVGGLTMMNYGYSIASNAVERTQVQATMNGQLAYIRHARDAYIRANQQATDSGSQLWAAIIPKIVSGATSSATCSGTAPQQAANSFYIRDDVAGVGAGSIVNFTGTPATTLAQPGNGMWIEARRAGGAVGYVDFYVKACWQPVGNLANQEARVVMRLYVP